jgi:hypothetical protein
MATNYAIERSHQSRYVHTLTFAGDGVCLAAQVDYPRTPPNYSGTYPLLFMLHHAGCHPLEHYAHFAHIGLESGFIVFRWDKRGSGRSGAGGRGSTTQDAVNAYEIALEQQKIDPRRTVIVAPAEGGLMLAESFGLFARIQKPSGVILAGNMLDADHISAIDAPVLVISGENDWMDWRAYGPQAAAAHKVRHEHSANFFLAKGADRGLMVEQNDRLGFHKGARQAIKSWLADL